MRVNHDFFATRIRIHVSWSGSESTFHEMDPDPAKWIGSERIRIRNTVPYLYKQLRVRLCKFHIQSYSQINLITLGICFKI